MLQVHLVQQTPVMAAAEAVTNQAVVVQVELVVLV
jgi:hypothetical protein